VGLKEPVLVTRQCGYSFWILILISLEKMSRLGVFLLFALAALAHAAVPAGNQNRLVAVEKSKPLCKDCEKVIMSLKKILEDPDLDAKLVESLHAVCDSPLFGRFKQQCTNMANYIIVVFHRVQGLVDDPTATCDTLKLCSSEAPSSNTVMKRLLLSAAGKFVQDIKSPHPINAIDTCSLCTSALNELHRILDTPEILEKVQTGLEKLCKYAGKYQTDCVEAVEAYLPKLVQIVFDAMCDPQQICAAIKLCKRSPTDAFLALARVNPRLASMPRYPTLNRVMANITTMQTSLGINMGCFTCKAAVETVEKTLSGDKVLTTLTQDATDLVCKVFPNTLKAGCIDFMGIYFKAALQLTVNEWTPAEICTDLHACNAVFLQQIQSLSMVETSAVTCDACKILSKVLSFELQQPSFQQDIIDVLTRGCAHLPAKFGDKCGDLVIEFVPFGLSYAADFLSRSDACSTVRLC